MVISRGAACTYTDITCCIFVYILADVIAFCASGLQFIKLIVGSPSINLDLLCGEKAQFSLQAKVFPVQV